MDAHILDLLLQVNSVCILLLTDPAEAAHPVTQDHLSAMQRQIMAILNQHSDQLPRVLEADSDGGCTLDVPEIINPEDN